MTLPPLLQILLVCVCVILGGCVSGVYPIERHERWVAVAISTDRAVTVSHPAHVGQRLRLYVHGSWVPVVVSRVDGDLIEIEAADGVSLDLEPGDSGSPVALIIGRRK